MSIAANLIAACILWYMTGPYAGLIMGGAGVVLLILIFLFAKKPESPTALPQNITQTQEFNPQFNPSIHIGFPQSGVAVAEQEKLRHENLILEFMKAQRQPNRTSTYLVEAIASENNISMKEAADALESLYLKKLLFRSPIDAPGDFVYWLSDLV